MAEVFFAYGDRETDYLRKRDRKMAAAIHRIGHIHRACQDDLFEAVVNAIVGQQISTRAHRSIWRRVQAENGPLEAGKVLGLGRERVQGWGISWRKADYILEFAEKTASGSFDLEAVKAMDDEAAIQALSSCKGVGRWTAEMILLFCLQRPDIFSTGDLAIQRGLRMLYRHKALPPERLERYRKRFSPCCSVASLYLWAIAGGALPELTDPAG